MGIDNTIPEVARRQIERIAEVCERIKPLVVIHCITYNHEAFLKDALEGFLMQKTDFPFVAVVHDDASTDGTTEVLRTYAERYPDIILPIFEDENQYSKRCRVIRRVMKSAELATGAKYVAMCEGDDYWTYEYKLQKQVDFLESHPDYSLVFHNAKILNADGIITAGISLFQQEGSRAYSAIDIIYKWPQPTASVLYRIEVDQDPILQNGGFRCSDDVLFLTATKYGKIYCIHEEWSVYRIHMGGVSSNKDWPVTAVEHAKAVAKAFESSLGKEISADLVTRHYLILLKKNRVDKQYKKYFKYFFPAIKDCGLIIFESELKSIINSKCKRRKK